MRSLRFRFLDFMFLLTIPAWPQQVQTSEAPASAPKDPQAVAVLNQALTVGGGLSAIATIDDYTATGSVTYYLPDEGSGPVTVRESGLAQLRMDAQLPGGTRSEAMYDGEIRISERGVTSTSWDPPPFYPGRIVVPTAFMAAASRGPQFSLTYNGTAVIDGQVAFDIEVQLVVPAPETIRYREGLVMHLFVDMNTLQVVMMQDVDRRNQIRQVRYSDYRTVNGAQVPFAISEQIASHQTWAMKLSQINFNTGLQDSDFIL
jgi:hypothetical protein